MYKIEKDVIQSFIFDKIHSIDKVYESVIEVNGDKDIFINIEYGVRILDQWTFPKSHRISINDYISISREFKLNQILEDGSKEV